MGKHLLDFDSKENREFVKSLAITKDCSRAKNIRGERGSFLPPPDFEFPQHPPEDYAPETIVHPLTGETVIGYKHIPFSGTWYYDERIRRYIQKNDGRIPSNKIYDS